MSLSVVVIVEIIEITLFCLENVENEFIWFRTCRIYFYLFGKSRKLIYVV
jgi:hypothetical protein